MDRRAADVLDAVMVLLRSLRFTEVSQGAMNRLISMVWLVADEIGDAWSNNRDQFTEHLFNAVHKYGISTATLQDHFHYFSRLYPPEPSAVSSSIVVSSAVSDSLEPSRKLFFAPSYQEFLASIGRAQ